MLGGAQIVGGKLMRDLPEVYPDIDSLYCISCNLREGIGRPRATGTFDSVEYDRARYEVTYSILPYLLVPDEAIHNTPGEELGRFVERQVQYEVEAITLPGAAFKWVDTGTSIMEPGVKNFWGVTQEWNWFGLPDYPRAALVNCLGKTNSADFDGYPAGTLLLLSPEVRLIPTASPA